MVNSWSTRDLVQMRLPLAVPPSALAASLIERPATSGPAALPPWFIALVTSDCIFAEVEPALVSRCNLSRLGCFYKPNHTLSSTAFSMSYFTDCLTDCGLGSHCSLECLCSCSEAQSSVFGRSKEERSAERHCGNLLGFRYLQLLEVNGKLLSFVLHPNDITSSSAIHFQG